MGKASQFKKEMRALHNNKQKPLVNWYDKVEKSQEEWDSLIKEPMVDDWTEIDRTYFKENPTKKFYIRKISFNESKPFWGKVKTMPRVKVTNIAEGFRSREFIF